MKPIPKECPWPVDGFDDETAALIRRKFGNLRAVLSEHGITHIAPWKGNRMYSYEPKHAITVGHPLAAMCLEPPRREVANERD